MLKEAYNVSQQIPSTDQIPESDRFSDKQNKEFAAATIDQEGIDEQKTRGKDEPLGG